MEKEFVIRMEQIADMQFKTTFDKENFPELLFDEPPSVPGGKGEYPNASRVIAAAVANCLSASMQFCMIKSHVEVHGMETVVKATIDRNDAGYWRIKKLDVDMTVKNRDMDENTIKKFERCKERFFNYCIVSASIKEGIEINVNPKLVKE